MSLYMAAHHIKEIRSFLYLVTVLISNGKLNLNSVTNG